MDPKDCSKLLPILEVNYLDGVKDSVETYFQNYFSCHVTRKTYVLLSKLNTIEHTYLFQEQNHQNTCIPIAKFISYETCIPLSEVTQAKIIFLEENLHSFIAKKSNKFYILLDQIIYQVSERKKQIMRETWRRNILFYSRSNFLRLYDLF